MKLLRLILALSLVLMSAPFTPVALAATDCIPCDSADQFEGEMLLNADYISFKPVLEKSLAHASFKVAANRDDTRLDFNDTAFYAHAEFDLMCVPLLDRATRAPVGLLISATSAESDETVVFSYEFDNGDVNQKFYLPNGEIVSYLIEIPDSEEFARMSIAAEKGPCELLCAIIVGGAGCTAFCTTYGAILGGPYNCGMMCSGGTTVFCDWACANPALPPVITCGGFGLPDCDK